MKSFLDFNLITNYSQLTNVHIVGYNNNQEVKIDFLTFGVGLYNYLQQLDSQYNFVTSDYETLLFDTSQISNLYLETGITNFSYSIEDQYLTLLPLSSGRVNLEYTQGLSGTRQHLNVGNYLFVKSLSTNQMYTLYYAATGSDMFTTIVGADGELGEKGPSWSNDDDDYPNRSRINKRPPHRKKKSITPIISNINWNPKCFGLGDDSDSQFKYTATLSFSVTLPRPSNEEFSDNLHRVKVIINNNFPTDIRFLGNTKNGKVFTDTKGPGDVIECQVEIKRPANEVQPIEIKVITDAHDSFSGAASVIVPFPPHATIQSILGKENVTISGRFGYGPGYDQNGQGMAFSINLDTNSCWESGVFYFGLTGDNSVGGYLMVVPILNADSTVTNKVEVVVSRSYPHLFNSISISEPLNGSINIPAAQHPLANQSNLYPNAWMIATIE